MRYIRSIVQSDAEYLVGTYCLVCEPHAQEEWIEYRRNQSNNYELYMEIRNTLPTTTEFLIDSVAKADNVRASAYENYDFQMVLEGYQWWLEEQ